MVWLGMYNACLLVGVLLGYAVGAIATVDSTLSWQYYYGMEALLMLLCGIMYSFIDPALIQVTRTSAEKIKQRLCLRECKLFSFELLRECFFAVVDVLSAGVLSWPFTEPHPPYSF